MALSVLMQHMPTMRRYTLDHFSFDSPFIPTALPYHYHDNIMPYNQFISQHRPVVSNLFDTCADLLFEMSRTQPYVPRLRKYNETLTRRRKRKVNAKSKLTKRTSKQIKTLLNDTCSKYLDTSTNGESYELRMSVPPHASVSNVSMELLPSSTAALRLLQVSIDLELRRSLAQYGQAWQMVSVAQQSVTRTLSLPNDAQLAGISVTLESKKEESDGDEVDHELVIRIPRDPVALIEVQQEAETFPPKHSQSTENELQREAISDNKVESEAQELLLDEESEEEHSQPTVSDVTVEDVESDEE